MSCFWDGLIASMNKSMLKVAGMKHRPKKQADFIQYLRDNNSFVDNVKWNDTELSEKEQEENYEWIKDYKPRLYNKGTDCSSSNPFIFLFCKLFHVSAIHQYNGHRIKYTNIDYPTNFVHFTADTGHFEVAHQTVKQNKKTDSKKKKSSKKKKKR